MGWQQQLRAASFRGAPFEATASSPTFGRRVQVHVYPGQDRPFTEDTGRRPREFHLSAVIVGDDYLERRDRLIAACEKPGPGTLVHPLYGEVEVLCTECSVAEGAGYGGSADLTLTFVEAGELLFPKATADGEARVNLAGDLARQRVIQDFATESEASGLYRPGLATDFIKQEIDKLIDRTRRSNVGVFGERIVEAGDRFKAGFDEAIAIEDALETFGNRIDASRQTAQAVGGTFADLIDAVGDAASDGGQRFQMFSGLAAFDPDLPATGMAAATAINGVERHRLDSMVTLTRRLALVETARAATRLPFASRNEAMTVRDELADRLDKEAISAADGRQDLTWRALTEVRAELAAHLTVLGETLARVMPMDLVTSVPALVLAYELYGDATRDAELARRNAVAHEGLLPVGVPLQVLTR